MASVEPGSQVLISETHSRESPANPLRRLTAGAPATDVLTDFERQLPLAVAPDQHVDLALNQMIVQGVRSLLVVEMNSVVGLITAGDILGPRPIQFLQSPLCSGNPCRHVDIAVRDIMTSWQDLEALEMSWVETHTCGEVAKVFDQAESTHIVVIERHAKGTTVRGILSKTRVFRQLS